MSLNSKKDFRFSDKCNPFNDVSKRKIELGIELDRAKNSIRGNHYGRLHDKTHPQHRPFRNIYNKRCAYCGLQQETTGSTEFEVDHYLSRESKLLGPDRLNHIDNLMYACNICNQGKSGLTINENYANIIHPDSDSIKNVFVRKSDYSISIQEEYKDDEFINTFYHKIHLGSTIRRIDYLICQLEHVMKIHPKLVLVYHELRKKRDENRELLKIEKK